MEEKRGRSKQGVWDEQIHTTVYKIDKNSLLYSTRNYIQHRVLIYNGK